MKNKYDHHLRESVLNKRLSLTEWKKEQDRINSLSLMKPKKEENRKKIKEDAYDEANLLLPHATARLSHLILIGKIPEAQVQIKTICADLNAISKNLEKIL